MVKHVDLWPQTKFILGSEKLDLVERGSGRVYIKVQGEFGVEKQRTLCYTGPTDPVTV